MYINNTKAIDLNPEKLINDANNSGQLAIAIKDVWKVSQMPLVSNILYEKHESKARRKNEVNIKVEPGSNNAENVNTVEMQQNYNSVEMKQLPPMLVSVIATDFGNIQHDQISHPNEDEGMSDKRVQEQAKIIYDMNSDDDEEIIGDDITATIVYEK